ncbi:MAG: 2-amino-4-hydroxy-6-hydroxymethyldihydropteridine diphosphokinase [Sedimentisphaerales bacterium]|nr:2-amino-4-hydroxy-6-hydroxymethyldihydropteridine diphosphokinase [Sedimentisphaerales bacterium]
MITAYIGLGSNLGDRQNNISSALEMLAQVPNIEVIRASEPIETEPLGRLDQPKYLNAVAELQTTLSPDDLLKRLVVIETSLGRKRMEKWSSRTIDLDILLYGADIVVSPHLTIPHSQTHLRSFVLEGLCRLDGNLIHPLLKESANELYRRLNGCDFTFDFGLPQLVSIAGVIGVGKTTLAKKIADRLGCTMLPEPYDTNPYMPDVYAGRKELALDSQLYFLTERVEQLNNNKLEKGNVYISDYIFDKELIYSRQTLNSEQLTLYNKIYRTSNSRITRPVLVIYLTDSPENCLERIHKRNRPYEQKIELRFLKILDAEYKQLFNNWKVCPVIRKKTSDLDYTKVENIENLAEQIKYYIAGRTVTTST